MPKVCIIIPFYNEAGRFHTSDFTDFLAGNEDYSLLTVNDGSSDQTAELLRNLEKERPQQIRVLDLQINSGKAEAVRQGILEALQWKDFDYLGYLDADLATPFSQVPYLLSFFEASKYKCVFGSRVKLFGLQIERSLKRHYFGRIFATTVSLMFDLEIYDTQCGAKFFSADIVSDIFKDKFVSPWFFDIEIFIRIRKELGDKLFKTTIKEVPLQEWTEKGDSKLQLVDFLNTPFELVKIKQKY